MNFDVATPNVHAWNSHITKRYSEAAEIGLLEAGGRVLENNARVFVPRSYTQKELAEVHPLDTAIRDLDKQLVVEGRWITRPDLFDSASKWLIRNTKGSTISMLVCEAGYSKVGDESLQRLQHLVWKGRPFLFADLLEESVDNITSVLRKSRSWRFLAVVVDWTESASYRPAKEGLFICDAFENDSLIIARFCS